MIVHTLILVHEYVLISLGQDVPTLLGWRKVTYLVQVDWILLHNV